jgi:hypothetical protein
LPAAVCGIQRATTVIGAGSPTQQMERDKTNWSFITPTNGAVVVTQKADVKAQFGKQFAVGAEGYTGTDSAGPTEEILYNVWCGNCASGGTGSLRLVCYVVVQYDTVFTEPKQLSTS